MKPLVSFIIPCYNGEKYIQSIINQLYSSSRNDFEVIVVNDGSKDNSDSIIKKLVNTYPSLNYIYQENKGASAARNTGLSVAKGQYICFLDCDDSIVISNMDKLLNSIYDKDLYLFNINKDTNGEIYPYIKQTNMFVNKPLLLQNLQFTNAPWGKLIKRDIIEKYSLYFDSQLKISEDLLWSIQLLNYVLDIECSDIDFYIYKTDNQNSTTNTISNSKFIHLWKTLEVSVNWCNQHNAERACYSMCAYQYMMNCAYCYPNYNEYKQYYKNYRYLLKYSDYSKVKTINKVVTLLGIKATSYLLHKYLVRK